MNILFISIGLDPSAGGTARVTRTLMDIFEKNGNKCFITYSSYDDKSLKEEQKKQVQYVGNYKEFRQSMYSFIEEKGIDVIIDENVCELNVSRFFKELKKSYSKLPIFYCLHNTPELFIQHSDKKDLRTFKNKVFKVFTGMTIYMWKHKRIYDVCDRYVVLSSSYIKMFYDIFNLHNDGRVIAIPNPISLTAKVNDNLKENLFLVVARLSEKQKNIKAILRIWKSFSATHYNYKLIIVGNGPDEGMLKTYSSQLGLDHVEFMGHQENPQLFYSRAKYFLMTSNFEGLPMTILEALQFKCLPIVFNSFAAINDIIADNVNGILVKKGDEREFLNKMNEIVDDEARQKRMIKNIPSSLQKFSKKSIFHTWISNINQVLNQNENSLS